MLKVDWVNRDTPNGKSSGYKGLVEALSSSQNESIFGTELIETLMDSFWSRWKSQIFWKALIPYLIYVCSMLVYYSVLLKKSPPEGEERKTSPTEIMVALSMIFLGTYFFYFEVRNWSKKSLR